MKYPEDFINKIICGAMPRATKDIPDESIDMCMTSPPYWGLRDYGVEQIFGGDSNCKHDFNISHRRRNDKSGGHGNKKYLGAAKAQDGARFGSSTKTCSKCKAWKGQLGLEPTPEFYIEHLTEIFSEAKRVLKKEGTLWLNLGDTYSTHTGKRSGQFGKEIKDGFDDIYTRNRILPLKEKCLCMVPERLAWSLIQDGWILRNKIIWIKPNSMPSSAKDRFANKWEYVFYFVKSQRNYFDLDAVREKHTWGEIDKRADGKKHKSKGMCESGQYAIDGPCYHPKGKNPGDIWTILTTPCSIKGIHFATFPEELCRKAIIPGCPEGGIVLDPFAGRGTTGYVVRKLGRKFIMIDIKQEYCDKAENKRLAQGVL